MTEFGELVLVLVSTSTYGSCPGVSALRPTQTHRSSVHTLSSQSLPLPLQGDLHIPHRASAIPEKFQRMLVPHKMQHVLCTGNLGTAQQLEELKRYACLHVPRCRLVFLYRWCLGNLVSLCAVKRRNLQQQTVCKSMCMCMHVDGMVGNRRLNLKRPVRVCMYLYPYKRGLMKKAGSV